MTDRVRKWLKHLLSSLELPAPEAAQRLGRIKAVERNIVLPLKAAAIGIILYSLHQSPWFGLPLGSLDITVNTVNTIFGFYVAANILAAAVLLFVDRLPFDLVRWSVFTISLTDGIFVGALTLVSGGHESLLFWLFLILIIRNVAGNPPVWSQLTLNACMAGCFALACILAAQLERQVASELTWFRPALPRAMHLTNGVPRTNAMVRLPPPNLHEVTVTDPAGLAPEGTTEEITVRVMVLLLGAVWLFGVQVLFEKQKLAREEAREFGERESQLRSAGRLAAEFAHQIKNPLGIISNAAYSLERGLKNGKGDPHAHLDIIKEEVRRADGIITQVMGYAELSEGRVEKLELARKIDQALQDVFPEGLTPGIRVERDLHGPFPPMFMQRRHLTEVLVNLLLNAREALNGQGRVTVAAHVRADLAVEITVTDTGPGIAPDALGRVFEAYFTTKERGTGLGLAIVKNNVELYGGSVRVESELGKGARFTVVFPAKASAKTNS